MTKHSLAFPAVPASAPTSPAVTRSKQSRNPPVTPQRLAHHGHVRQYSSPYTPSTPLSTPYTPLSLRSISSSNTSALATPASMTSNRRHSISQSPEVSLSSKSKRSLADIAENWRTRANENGIKVSSEDSHFVDDEDVDSSFFVNDKALLPAPFMSSQRRARAFSHVQQPLTQITNPAQFRASGNVSHPLVLSSPGVLNTPPRRPDVMKKYMLRGAVTDPAQTRRRPALGQMTELFDIDEDEYTPYPPMFSPLAPTHIQSQTLPLSLNDPFFPSCDLSAFSESSQFYESDAIPHIQQSYQPPPQEHLPSACSVCGSAHGALAILDPCTHPLCSTCLTSALNIVGEKDMECAVCKAKVEDFKLHNFTGTPGTARVIDEKLSFEMDVLGSTEEAAFIENYDFDTGIITSAFGGCAGGKFDDHIEFMDRAQGASTPVSMIHSDHETSNRADERVVLRIDNVPWDITPPAIATWLKHPVERVHVLLDRKGKTLSHAYAEMVNSDAAKAALRTAQNSVLGKGKRARGVTVTRSSQEELMRALFPSWQGTFDGARPSLAGLDNEHIIATLQHGLIAEAELTSMLHLIRSPDSHFLKVPSLPFHSLISMLSKFPSDDDSRVFWSSALRDMLYEVTYAAVQVLLARFEENPLGEWSALLTQVVRAAMHCQAFTSEQMSKLSDILEAALRESSVSPPIAHTVPTSPASTHDRPLQTQSVPSRRISHEPYNDLAEEFGVEAHLIEALAQRLSRI